MGSGADVVSEGELLKALKAKINPKKIVFSGVGKTDEEIEFALKNNIYCFNVESQGELDRIETIASSLNVKANISLRVNPEIDAKTHPYITTGLSENKFGIPINKASHAFDLARSLGGLDVVGIDGCTLPAPYLSLQGFARALAKITAPNLLKGKMQDAAVQIIKSTIKFPFLTGGTKSPNSIMTAASSKKFFAKNGAEGVYAVIFPLAKAAMVLKIADGNMRAANVAIAGMLNQMAVSYTHLTLPTIYSV